VIDDGDTVGSRLSRQRCTNSCTVDKASRIRDVFMHASICTSTRKCS